MDYSFAPSQTYYSYPSDCVQDPDFDPCIEETLLKNILSEEFYKCDSPATTDSASASLPPSPFSSSVAQSSCESPYIEEVVDFSQLIPIHSPIHTQWDIPYIVGPIDPLTYYANLPPMPEDEQLEDPLEVAIQPVGLDLAYSPAPLPLSPVRTISLSALPGVPPIRASADRASTVVSTLLAHDSDADAEGESEIESKEDTDDYEDDGDGEYVPSPLQPLRQRRAYQNAYNPRSSRKSRLSTPKKYQKAMSAIPGPTIKFEDANDFGSRIVRTAPRRVQVAPETPAAPSWDKLAKRPWQCPHCPYIQKNHREPDLKRHISTHFRDLNNDKYICCGVPVDQAKMYAVPQNAEVMHIWGRDMIGGCAKELSRKDALKRHLRNTRSCVGDLTGDWHPFNKQQ